MIESEMLNTMRLAPLALMLALAGCATSSPDVISRQEAQRLATVEDATVLSVRPVTVDGSQSGAGAVAGGAVGAMAGSSVGGHRESGIYGVLGAVAGAVAGNVIERSTTQEASLELMLQLRNGQRRAVVQAAGSETFKPGDAVIIVNSGGRVRVTRAPAVSVPQSTPETPPAPVPGARS